MNWVVFIFRWCWLTILFSLILGGRPWIFPHGGDELKIRELPKFRR